MHDRDDFTMMIQAINRDREVTEQNQMGRRDLLRSQQQLRGAHQHNKAEKTQSVQHVDKDRM